MKAESKMALIAAALMSASVLLWDMTRVSSLMLCIAAAFCAAGFIAERNEDEEKNGDIRLRIVREGKKK